MAVFESIGFGTQRYDLFTSYEPPDAIVILRTRWDDVKNIKPFALELAQKLQGAVPQLNGRAACIRMQVLGDQTAEACSIILNTTSADVTTVSTLTLEAYRTVLKEHRAVDPSPPISHDLTLLPTGQSVQYQGRD